MSLASLIAELLVRSAEIESVSPKEYISHILSLYDSHDSLVSEVKLSIWDEAQMKTGWQCDTCLVDNIAESTFCEACSPQSVSGMSFGPSHDGSVKLSIWDEAQMKTGWQCDTCLVDNLAESTFCEACSPQSIAGMSVGPSHTRSYRRVVPLGDISDYTVGYRAQDKNGRWHEIAEVRAFSNSTRKTWRLITSGLGVQEHQPVSLVDYSDSSCSDRETEPFKQRTYTSLKPSEPAKSLSVGTIQEGKDGDSWIVRQFTGKRGTRNQWCRNKSPSTVFSAISPEHPINVSWGKHLRESLRNSNGFEEFADNMSVSN